MTIGHFLGAPKRRGLGKPIKTSGQEGFGVSGFQGLGLGLVVPAQ